MATREEALARLNNIKQQRQQNIQERYNNIIKNRDTYIAQQRQLHEQQKLEEEQRKLEQEEEKRKLQQLNQKASKINSFSKNANSYEQNRKNQILNASNLNIKNSAVKINAENLSKDTGLSLDVTNKILNEQPIKEKSTHENKSYSLKQNKYTNIQQDISKSKTAQMNKTGKYNSTKKTTSNAVESVSKELNLPTNIIKGLQEEEKRRVEGGKAYQLAKDIESSNFGRTSTGKKLADLVESKTGKTVINTANAIANGELENFGQGAYQGAVIGGLDSVSYANKVARKVNKTFNNLINGKYETSDAFVSGALSSPLASGALSATSIPKEIIFGSTGRYLANKLGINNKLNELSLKLDNYLQEEKEKANNEIQRNIDENTSTVTRKLSELAPSIGNNMMGVAIKAINPVAGTTYFISSASGSYYDDAINRGMNEDQALAYGTIAGTMEGLTEEIGVKKSFEAGLLLGKGEIEQALIKLGISVNENFAQEAIMEPIQEVSALITGGKDKADFTDMGSRMIQSGIDGALSSLIMSGSSASVKSAQRLQEKIIKGQTVTDKELQQCMKDIQESGKVNVEQIVNQEMQYQTQKAKSIYYDYYTGEKADSNTQNILNQAEDIINRNNVLNIEQNATKNQRNVHQQQISQVENENGLNPNVEGQNATKFSKILNNKKLPMQSYIYEKSDNIIIDNLRKQANKFFNNSQEAHDYMSMLEKIIIDKNVEIVFDANLKDENGNLANGKYESGVITINPNSNRVGEFIAIHELTHAIGTKALRKIVDEYRKSNPEFDKAVQKLLSNYKQTEITEEALSDVCAQLFGNQEYINNLATKNPNLFQKIYSEIKYLWHQFNGYKNKEQFVEDLMFKWEQAYRKNTKLNNKIGYSFAGENAKIANFKNLDSAKQMEQQGKTEQEIFEQTGWYKGNEGKWRFELDDSSWNINDIKKLNTNGGLFILKDILDAPELYEAYPDIKNLPVIFDKTMHETNNGALETDFSGEQKIRLNSNNVRSTDAKSYEMLGLKNQSEIFSILQHEIQHYIQRKEGFSTGANPQYWADIKNYEFQNDFRNLFGDITKLQKEYGFDKATDIHYNLGKYLSEKIRILNLQESILESKSKINTENNDMYQENINRANRFIEETNQWLEETKKDLESLVGKNGLKKVETAYNKYLDFLNNRAEISYNLYRNTAGEQEARNVQDRIKLSSEEKKNTLPFIKNENTVYAKDSNESFSQKQTVENKANKVYNRITAKERNQIISEVMTWKNNQEDGIYYIDLSKNGYYSYIYEKNGDSVIPIRKIIGSEEFLNAVRKGVENGTYQESETINKWLTTVKNESKNNRSSNVGLPKGRTYNRNARIYSNDLRTEKTSNRTGINGKNIRDGGLDDSSSFNLSKTDNQGRILTKEKVSYDNKNKALTYDNKPLYFRFDDKEGFRGEEHQSGISMWEEHIDDLISENTDMEFDSEDNIIVTNKLLENYGLTSNEYDSLSYEKQVQVKRRIALDEGLITDGASVFNLSDEGLKFFESYDKTHSETDYEVVHFFTGEENGYGADGETVVKPRQVVLKMESTELLKIINEVEEKAEDLNWTRNQIYKEIQLEIQERIKNTDNTNHTDNQDIRYSKDNSTWQQYLEKEFPARGATTNFQDIKLPTKDNMQGNVNLPPKSKTINSNQKQETSNAQEQVSGNIKYKDTTTKVRKHYKSIIDSPYTSDEARAISKELMGLDTYIPESNTKQLEEADRRISISGADSELDSLLARATVGGNIKADDIAVGERLIQYYSKTGNKTKLRDAIQATAMAGTTAGQTVQAMSLLNHQTPEGQAVWLQRSVEKMNNDLKKSRGAKAEQFTLTEDMLDKIVNSANTEELNQNLDEVYKELGQQVTKSTIQKIDAWRYFAMLANIRTHNRNVIGNTAMHGIQYGIKNKVAGAIEGVVSKINPNMERTHTIIPASKEVKVFAKADIKNVADRLGLNENKYNPKSRLENNMRTFKSNVMEKTVGKAFEINNKLLEAEDGFGLKAGYTKALAEYMTANKLTPNNITDKQLAKARNYAIQQAQEATFHQNSQLATLINQLSNKNKFAKFMVDAILPFKKTPINIAKTGVQYSPIGLAKNMVYDTVQLRKGNITANQYIDNISKGLTGTGIALVGFALASMGILKASGSEDDDKEKYDQSRGTQTYSVQIGDNTYSLDWLAPTAIPLFVGAECFELMEESRETKSSISTDDDSSYNQAIQSAVNVLDSFTNAMNPMTEMSMLSGLSSALKSYEQGSSQVLSTFGTNAVKSYVNQFVPTALGQIAKTTDEYERSTTSTKTGVLPKAVDTTKNQIMSKIPGLRQMLPIKTDIWGNELKQSDNMALRALENSTFPWTRKEVANSKVEIELSKLYEATGESSVLPDTLDKTFTINKQKYRLTNEEYAEYKASYGRTSYKLLKELVTTSNYKNMTTTQKQKAVENVYSYAKEINKIDYADNNDLEVETSTLYDTLEAIEKAKGNKSDYVIYLSEIADIEGQGADKKKINVLANTSYNSETKRAIYENSIGKDDELYNTVMKNTGINMKEYLNYKSQTFTSDKKDDGTLDGKSISGSKKQKVFSYVNNMKITGNQRLLLLGTQYKLTNSERIILAQYVKSLNITNKEKLEIYDKLQGFTVYKDGRVKF